MRLLKKIYEDGEIEIYRSLDDRELEEAIVDAIREAGRPLTWRELKEKFSAIAGDDRLREALKKLIMRDVVIEMPDGAFGLPGMEKTYIPRRVKRVRPLVPSKFYARWGRYAAQIRRTGLPVEEAVKLLGIPSRASAEDLEEAEGLEEFEEFEEEF